MCGQPSGAGEEGWAGPRRWGRARGGGIGEYRSYKRNEITFTFWVQGEPDRVSIISSFILPPPFFSAEKCIDTRDVKKLEKNK